jgi:hypothetical protein
VLDHPVLIRRQLHNNPNWSSFGFAMNPNLDQFGDLGGGGSIRVHMSLRAGTG